MSRKDKRSPLDKLRKHWQRADTADRQAFVAQLRQEGFLAGDETDGMQTSPDQQPGCGIDGANGLIANGRYLLPLTVARIEAIMIRRRITPVDVMREAGFAGDGAVLTRALIRQASLRLAVIAALRDWLRENEAEPSSALPETDPLPTTETSGDSPRSICSGGEDAAEQVSDPEVARLRNR